MKDREKSVPTRSKIRGRLKTAKNPSRRGPRFGGASFFTEHDECPYHGQFNQSTSMVRVYTHDRLFIKSKYDRTFRPKFIIVDEDIIAKIAKERVFLIQGIGSEYASLNGIIKTLWNGESLQRSARNALNDLLADREKAAELLEKEQAALRVYTKAKEENLSRLHDQKPKVERLEKLVGLLSELSQIAVGSKIQSKHVWINWSNGDKEPPKLVYGDGHELLPEFRHVPMLYLDASGERKVIEAGLGREMEFEHIRVEQQPNAKVFQFKNDASFSKYAFSQNAGFLTAICGWVNSLDARRVGLIRYKDIVNIENYFQPLDNIITQNNRGEKRIGWFGNIRGLNTFEDCDTLIVLGQHRLPSYMIANRAQLLFREDFCHIDDMPEWVDDRQLEARLPIEKVYRMKYGNNFAIKQTDYIEPFSNLISNHFDKAETYQALHRLRLIHGSSPKTVYLLSDAVLDVSLDGFLDRYKELGEKNLQVVKYIRQHKFLDDKNDQSFVDAMGWSRSEAESFRRDDPNKGGSGQWLKSHRSLIHWTYETKKRTKGKCYSWRDQTETDVIAWLSVKGIEVKKLVKSEALPT